MCERLHTYPGDANTRGYVRRRQLHVNPTRGMLVVENPRSFKRNEDNEKWTV